MSKALDKVAAEEGELPKDVRPSCCKLYLDKLTQKGGLFPRWQRCPTCLADWEATEIDMDNDRVAVWTKSEKKECCKLHLSFSATSLRTICLTCNACWEWVGGFEAPKAFGYWRKFVGLGLPAANT